MGAPVNFSAAGTYVVLFDSHVVILDGPRRIQSFHTPNYPFANGDRGSTTPLTTVIQSSQGPDQNG